MGKRLPSQLRLDHLGRAAAERLRTAKAASRVPASPLASNKDPSPCSSSSAPADPAMSTATNRAGAGGERREGQVPLREVVADCVKRWFQDALKEAKDGDTSMQVLVGQMYHSGYGVAKNDQKANAWIAKASRSKSSVWKVSDKRPGYNASDSDSDSNVEEGNLKS